jgi:choice-of-anchor B domain-containing protein
MRCVTMGCRPAWLVWPALLFLAIALPGGAAARPTAAADKHEDGGQGEHGGGSGDPTIAPLPALGAVKCRKGRANVYPCHNVDLLSFVPLAELSPEPDDRARGLWGWTDPQTKREYALVPLAWGTSFVDVTDGARPRVVGYLPGATGQAVSNREVNVYADHALIVADGSAAQGHGVQVFDLAQLRDVTDPPAQFTASTVFTGVGRVHTITVNPDSGFAYANGSDQCGGGPYFIDVREPSQPRQAGCYSAHFYTHDNQCVVYHGPDARYAGRELCFASNQDRLVIVDVTEKGAPVAVSATPYRGWTYTHQGALTEDHRYFLLDDEGDEFLHGHNSRTWLWDLVDLTAPRLFASHEARTAATDHNQFVRGGFVYQANYRAGLRILDLAKIAGGRLTEVASFDIVPDSDEPGFSGAWNVYPYFADRKIIVSGIEQGLYVLRWNGSRRPAQPAEKVPAKCRPGKDNLCLLGGRFSVDIGEGRLRALDDSAALVHFGDEEDIEMVVTLLELDGQPHVAYAELTERPFTLRLMDTRAKQVRRYHNRTFCHYVETFAGADGGADGGSCVPSALRLCLHRGRFAVEATWRELPRPRRTGDAQAIALSDLAGGFASGLSGVVELFAKVTVDAGEARVWWTKLSDLEYTFRVTDTATGVTHDYVDHTEPVCTTPDPLF